MSETAAFSAVTAKSLERRAREAGGSIKPGARAPGSLRGLERFLFSFSWGWRPRLYASARSAGSAPEFPPTRGLGARISPYARARRPNFPPRAGLGARISPTRGLGARISADARVRRRISPHARVRRSNVTFVVFDTIDFEKIDELIPERYLPMMLFLIRNVALHLFQI